MSDTVQLIKDKLSILDVISPYVKLTRAGKHYKGLSPFTKEKTPSFFVAPDRGLYHCFSTGKGGDMFTFIEEMEGLDFKGALAMLGEKAGVEVTPQKAGERDMRERLYGALSEAESFFIDTLQKKADAKKYLIGRGLKEETISSWKLGYALKEWQSLHGALSQKGYTDIELERAGLIKKRESESSESRFYDRFRGRIIFPIREVSERVIGFSGRLFEEEGEETGAKYLNSPETELFDKSRALYGIERAREGIRKLGAVILVEGQLDLLMMHQAGYKNAVATSGTSFTEKHAEALKRYTPNLLIAYDGDRAGIAATGRAAAIGLRKGMNVKAAKLTPGKDPAELLKENPAVLKEAIKEAHHIVDFYLAHLTDAKYDPRTFRLEVSRTVLPYVAMIGNAIDRAHFTKRVSETIGVPEEAVREEVKKAGTAERMVEGALPVSLSAAEPFLSRSDSIIRLLFGLMLYLKEKGEVAGSQKAEDALRGSISDSDFNALSEEEKKRAALFEAEIFLERYSAEGTVLELVEELSLSLKKEALHEKYRDTLSHLRSAEIASDSGVAEKLLAELSSLASSFE